MQVVRVDFGTVSNVQRTPQGGLRVDARLTKAGVLTYRDSDGNQWGELRPPEEVFKADSLATLRDAPVTVQHPPGLVTPANWREVAKGHVAEMPRQDEGAYVAAPVVVQDADAVRAIEAGELHDVSAGYTCDIDPTPGVYEGVPYKQIQRNVRYNHAALLPEGSGRAGTDVALRLDGAAVQVNATRHDAAHAQERSMKTITVLGKTYRCDDAGDMGNLQKDVTAVQTKADADSAAYQSQIDALKKSLTDALTQVAMMEAAHLAEEAAEGESMDDELQTVQPEEVLDAKRIRRVVTTALLGKGAIPAKGLRADAVRTLLAAKLDSRIEARAEEITKLRTDAAKVLGDADLKGKSPIEIRKMVLAKIAPTVKLDALDAKSIGLVFDASVAAFESMAGTRRSDAHAEIHRTVVEQRNDAAADTLESAQDALRRESEERGRKPLKR